MNLVNHFRCQIIAIVLMIALISPSLTLAAGGGEGTGDPGGDPSADASNTGQPGGPDAAGDSGSPGNNGTGAGPGGDGSGNGYGGGNDAGAGGGGSPSGGNDNGTGAGPGGDGSGNGYGGGNDGGGAGGDGSAGPGRGSSPGGDDSGNYGADGNPSPGGGYNSDGGYAGTNGVGGFDADGHISAGDSYNADGSHTGEVSAADIDQAKSLGIDIDVEATSQARAQGTIDADQVATTDNEAISLSAEQSKQDAIEGRIDAAFSAPEASMESTRDVSVASLEGLEAALAAVAEALNPVTTARATEQAKTTVNISRVVSLQVPDTPQNRSKIASLQSYEIAVQEQLSEDLAQASTEAEKDAVVDAAMSSIEAARAAAFGPEAVPGIGPSIAGEGSSIGANDSSPEGNNGASPGNNPGDTADGSLSGADGSDEGGFGNGGKGDNNGFGNDPGGDFSGPSGGPSADGDADVGNGSPDGSATGNAEAGTGDGGKGTSASGDSSEPGFGFDGTIGDALGNSGDSQGNENGAGKGSTNSDSDSNDTSEAAEMAGLVGQRDAQNQPSGAGNGTDNASANSQGQGSNSSPSNGSSNTNNQNNTPSEPGGDGGGESAFSRAVGSVEAAIGAALSVFNPVSGATARSLPRGVRNNNPGNIEKGSSAWQGMVAGRDSRFASFATPEQGIRAVFKTFSTYESRYGLLSVRAKISRWAPPSENNTTSYVNAVAKAMNINPDVPFSIKDPELGVAFVNAVIDHENGMNPYSGQQVSRAQEMAFGKTNRGGDTNTPDVNSVPATTASLPAPKTANVAGGTGRTTSPSEQKSSNAPSKTTELETVDGFGVTENDDGSFTINEGPDAGEEVDAIDVRARGDGSAGGTGTANSNDNSTGQPSANGTANTSCNCVTENITGNDRPGDTNQSYKDTLERGLTALQAKYPGLEVTIFSGTQVNPNHDPAKADGTPSGRHAHGNGGDTNFSIDGRTVTDISVLADIVQTMATINPKMGVGYSNKTKTITHLDFEPNPSNGYHGTWGYSGAKSAALQAAYERGAAGQSVPGVSEVAPAMVGNPGAPATTGGRGDTSDSAGSGNNDHDHSDGGANGGGDGNEQGSNETANGGNTGGSFGGGSNRSNNSNDAVTLSDVFPGYATLNAINGFQTDGVDGVLGAAEVSDGNGKTVGHVTFNTDGTASAITAEEYAKLSNSKAAKVTTVRSVVENIVVVAGTAVSNVLNGIPAGKDKYGNQMTAFDRVVQMNAGLTSWATGPASEAMNPSGKTVGLTSISGVTQAIVSGVRGLFSGLRSGSLATTQSATELSGGKNTRESGGEGGEKLLLPYKNTTTVAVTVDKQQGTVNFKKADPTIAATQALYEEYGNPDSEEPNYETSDLLEDYSSPESIVLNEFGDIVFSDGTYAPVTVNGVTYEEDDEEYVYLVKIIDENGVTEQAPDNSVTTKSNSLQRFVGTIFSDDGPYNFADINFVQRQYVDPNPEILRDEYYDYIIKLQNGTKRIVQIPEFTSIESAKHAFSESGYDGNILKIFSSAIDLEPVVNRNTEGTLGVIRTIFGNIVTLFQSDADSERQKSNTDLTSLIPTNDGTYGINDIRKVTVYLDIPTACPQSPGLDSAFIYEVVVAEEAIPGAPADGVLRDVRCGVGDDLYYASEISALLQRSEGFAAINPLDLLEKITFNESNPIQLETTDEGVVIDEFTAVETPSESGEYIPNTTNTVSFEVMTVDSNGEPLTDWTTDKLTVTPQSQLYFRWNGNDYARCLPSLADNGQYALTQNKGTLTNGNTYLENYQVPTRTGTYYVECAGQDNGEFGVDVAGVEIVVQ